MAIQNLGFVKYVVPGGLTSKSEWSNMKLVNHGREKVKSTCDCKKLKYANQPYDYMNLWKNNDVNLMSIFDHFTFESNKLLNYLFHDGFRSLLILDEKLQKLHYTKTQFAN